MPKLAPMYNVRKAKAAPALKGKWDGEAWSAAEELAIAKFRPESSVHHPETKAKLLYDERHLYVIFKVNDRFVRCVKTKYQEITSRDSCVELFVKPKQDKGYFAFEINCGGTLLFHYITDPVRVPNGLKEFVRVPWDDGREVGIHHSAPSVIEPEIQDEFVWTIEIAAPLRIFEKFVGPLAGLEGQSWEANLFKCGDETSHPHWASWSPVDELNFHMPRCFGTFSFLV